MTRALCPLELLFVAVAAALVSAALLLRPPEPAVAVTDEISYGWTRRGMSRNSRGGTMIVPVDSAVVIVGEPGR